MSTKVLCFLRGDDLHLENTGRDQRIPNLDSGRKQHFFLHEIAPRMFTIELSSNKFHRRSMYVRCFTLN